MRRDVAQRAPEILIDQTTATALHVLVPVPRTPHPALISLPRRGGRGTMITFVMSAPRFTVPRCAKPCDAYRSIVLPAVVM